MNLEKLGIMLYTCLLAAIIMIFGSACTRTISVPDEQFGNEEPASQPVQPVDLGADKASQNDWQNYSEVGLGFRYPADWQVETTEASGVLLLQVKSTDKQVMLGGAAPDDYYVEVDGTNKINTEKYADRFILISVSIYSGYQGRPWQDFVDQIYTDVVTEFHPYQVPFQPEIEGVAPTNVSGVLAGQPRFFARSGDKIYDFSLYYSDQEKQEAYSVFNAFLADFQF